jgi:hypothetical protein
MRVSPVLTLRRLKPDEIHLAIEAIPSSSWSSPVKSGWCARRWMSRTKGCSSWACRFAVEASNQQAI